MPHEFKACVFTEGENWLTLAKRYSYSHELLRCCSPPLPLSPLFDAGLTDEVVESNLNLHKAVLYAQENLQPAMRLILFPVVYLATQMQDPCAIAALYSTHFPYIEFQDCEGDHAKVIYKYVKMYLKIPLVISFVENEMVKRGMDTSVGQHVLNSMQMLGLGHHCCDMHDAIIPEVGPIFVDLMVPLSPPMSRHMDMILLGVSDCETPQSFLDYLNSALSHVSASQAAPMRAVRDEYLKYCALV